MRWDKAVKDLNQEIKEGEEMRTEELVKQLKELTQEREIDRQSVTSDRSNPENEEKLDEDSMAEEREEQGKSQPDQMQLRPREKSKLQTPLVIGGPRARYIPWKSLDLEGLVKSLPSLHEGAAKWIREFEDETQGKRLAIRDLKAIMARMLGAAETVRLLREAGNRGLDRVDETIVDRVEFDPYRNDLWQVLRATFPSRPDLNRLQGEQVGETEHLMVYYQKMKRKWQMETDSDLDADYLHTTMFTKVLLDGKKGLHCTIHHIPF